MNMSEAIEREKKIAEIREALEKATPGPWHMSKLSAGYLVDDRGKDITVFIEYNEDGSVHMEFENWQNNACLIANAPEWLRFLLSELERMEREHAEERAAHNAHVTELEQERDKLIEGLRWYADTKNYEYRTSYLDQDAPIIDDSGQRARDILKEIGAAVMQHEPR